MKIEESILKKIVKKCECDITGEVLHISYYTSSMEGLGTKSSDIDVYVIYEGIVKSESADKRNFCIVDLCKVDDVDLDIEYYRLVDLKIIMDKIANYSHSSESFNVFDINLEIAKFFHKFATARIIEKSNQINYEQITELEEKNKKMISRNYYSLFRGDYDDAIKFLREDRFLECFYMLQKAFINLSFAYFSRYNLTTTKGKWFIQRMLQVGEKDNGLLYDAFQKYYLVKIEDINLIFIKDFIKSIKKLSLEVI